MYPLIYADERELLFEKANEIHRYSENLIFYELGKSHVASLYLYSESIIIKNIHIYK